MNLRMFSILPLDEGDHLLRLTGLSSALSQSQILGDKETESEGLAGLLGFSISEIIGLAEKVVRVFCC